MSENILTLTSSNFQEIISKNKIVVVDFWASWCGPCQMFASIFEDFAKSNKEVVCGKVNVDEEANLSQKYSVMSIPTILFFKEGKLIKQETGAMPKQILEKIIKEL